MTDADAERTRGWYRSFANSEARDRSPRYEEWSRGVAEDDELVRRLGAFPLPKRQPNLLLGASRFAGAPEAPFPEWRDWTLAHWDDVASVIRARWTQTNEVLRCAALLPALATIPGPLAVLEVGTSAGLCLLLDRYSYRWETERGEVRLDPDDGPSPVELRAVVRGRPTLPGRMPPIVWRAGIDRAPIELADADSVRWLETLVWPEEHHRRDRLRAALELARTDPPRVVEGDVLDRLDALAAEAPAGATLVVVASAALVYLDPDARAALLDRVAARGSRLLSLEGRGVIPAAAAGLDPLRAPSGRSEFVLALDDRPLALVDPHGAVVDAEGIPWPA